MSKIEFPLRQGMEQGGVAELHAALGLLELSVDRRELDARSFGPSTAEAVRALQTQGGLPASGEIDEATAALLERRRADRGATAAGSTTPEAERYSVQGTVRDAVGRGLAGRNVAVVALKLRREEDGQRKTTRPGFYRLETRRPARRAATGEALHVVVPCPTPRQAARRRRAAIAQTALWDDSWRAGEFPGESEFEARARSSARDARASSPACSRAMSTATFVLRRRRGVDLERWRSRARAPLRRSPSCRLRCAGRSCARLPASTRSAVAASDRGGAHALVPSGGGALRASRRCSAARSRTHPRGPVPLRVRWSRQLVVRLAGLPRRRSRPPYGGTANHAARPARPHHLPPRIRPLRGADHRARRHPSTRRWARAAGELAEDETRRAGTFDLGAFGAPARPDVDALKRLREGRFSAHARVGAYLARLGSGSQESARPMSCSGHPPRRATPRSRRHPAPRRGHTPLGGAGLSASSAAARASSRPSRRFVVFFFGQRRGPRAARGEPRIAGLRPRRAGARGTTPRPPRLWSARWKKLRRPAPGPTPAAAFARSRAGSLGGRVTRAGRGRVVPSSSHPGRPRGDAEKAGRRRARGGLLFAHAR